MRRRILALAEDHLGPVEVARALLAELADVELRDVLSEILPAYCQTVLSYSGSKALGNASRSSRSPKLDAIRKWHEGFLKIQLHVGGERRKLMGDCNTQDLWFAATERREIAAKTLHRAAELEALAAGLHDYGVETVAELPADVARKLITEATKK